MNHAGSLRIEDPEQFFKERGGLHDSSIVEMIWRQETAELSIEVDDLNANFEGPEYRGAQPAIIRFIGVQTFSCDLTSIEGRMNIFETTVSKGSTGPIDVVISTWSSIAIIRIRCSELIVAAAEVA